MKLYQSWSSSPDQSLRFFADEVPECIKVTLGTGNTMFIPTGWIHAVFTPKDSIVIGGNFLHGFDISGQLQIYSIENATNVPMKFRFPYYERMQWYALEKYTKDLKSGMEFSPFELFGLKSLIQLLRNWLKRDKYKEDCPLKDPIGLLEVLKDFISSISLVDFEVSMSVPLETLEYCETLQTFETVETQKTIKTIKNVKNSSKSPLETTKIVSKKATKSSQIVKKQKSIYSRLSKAIRNLKK